MSKELRTSWGWGRPSPPDAEVQHYRFIPWWLIYSLDAGLSFYFCYLLYGFESKIIYWFITFPIFALLLAFPALSMVVIPYSYITQPGTKGLPEKYFVFKNPSFESKWKGKRIPVLTLYEAFFRGDLDLQKDENGKERDLLATLYERKYFTRFVLEFEHAKFFLTKLIPELLTHSRVQDVDQVREHYDRGDDFYAAFLGPTMIYTSGIWQNADDTLETAQRNKMDLIANKIHMKPGDVHLDLGCGWGTFIAHCAKHYGTDSTGITLGRNQTEWANRVAQEAGVASSSRALCTDYRDVPEKTNFKKFDKITCLEMSEHVGVKNYPAFCRQVYDMLKDDGMFYLQIAGLRRPFMYEDLTWGLFMGNYIFPGADASCPLGWVINQLEAAGFEVHTVETIGIHYSATIKRWYDNWNKPENVKFITQKYGQRWQRLWNWFLAWSVISPEQGSATCYQIVCHKNTSRFDRKIYIAERAKWKV